MPQHGDYDPQQQKWHCGYWMSQEEWLDIHDYAPPTPPGGRSGRRCRVKLQKTYK